MSRDRDAREPGRVYVGDLGSGGSKPELEREFERYGTLKSVWVARNPPGKSSTEICHLQKSKSPYICFSGFAFIEFDDPRDAEDAVRDMDGRFVCGCRIRVEMAKSNSRYIELLVTIYFAWAVRIRAIICFSHRIYL